MPRITRSDVIVPKSLGADEREKLIDALYNVHSQIFDGVEREGFAKYVVNSKAEHTWILVHKGEEGEIVGYFALHVFEKELGGKPAAVFRAEAGTLRDYRGNNSNVTFAFKEGMRYFARNAGKQMFYLGSLVHPSSYGLFGKYFDTVWPRAGAETPPELLAFMDELANTFGLERVDPANPLVRKVGWITRESEVEREYWRHCDKPAARFFIEANPGYVEGHGLVTVVPVTPGAMLTLFQNMMGDKIRRRTDVAKAMAWRMPIGAQLLKPAEVEKRLRAVPLFAHFDEDSLEKLTQRAEIVVVPAGRYIFRQGDQSDEMYLLARGAAFILVEGEGGEKEKVVDELSNGAIFGEIAMLAGERRSDSVRAATATTLVRIPKDVLMPLLEADAGLRWGVWRTFTGRRFDDHVRCLGRFAHLGRKARQAWFEKGSHHEVKAKEKLQVPAGRFVFVVSGVVELEHQGTWLTSRGPVLLRTQAACELTAQEAAQTILLPDAPAAEAPVRASA
ncbi:MAG TPA: cyclic nucleotide-binding domain-containing protein [Myxococcaceae bacterium]|nr:cyclic nucleotide-binding domain-containing protein [Myxococcaceae bacterium]